MDIKIKQRFLGGFVLLAVIVIFLVTLIRFSGNPDQKTSLSQNAADTQTKIITLNVEPLDANPAPVPAPANTTVESKNSLAESIEAAAKEELKLADQNQEETKNKEKKAPANSLPQVNTVSKAIPMGVTATTFDKKSWESVTKPKMSPAVLNKLIQQLQISMQEAIISIEPARALNPKPRLFSESSGVAMPVTQHLTSVGNSQSEAILQVGSFGNRRNGYHLCQQLQTKNLPAHCQSVAMSGKQIVRVYIGPAPFDKLYKWQSQLKRDFHLSPVIKRVNDE